jgi:hypothetical protein
MTGSFEKAARRADRILSALISCSVLSAFLALPASGVVVLGHIDDFSDGTLDSWAGGNGTGTVLINVPNGGPNGNGDRFLQVTATNSNLGTNNTVQWLGNYLAAGIAKVGFHLNNSGANPLELRISVFGPGGTFTTTNEVELLPGSGWVAVDFSLDASAFTQTAGGGTLAQTLANVSTLLLRHDPDPISPSGTPNPVTGQLRIDNIRAVPAAVIALGQLDDFQDGTLETWAGSSSPTNIPTGGPDGATDRYLQINASDGYLGTHNAVQWTGNYLVAEVGKIGVHLNNTGINPLALRLVVSGAGGSFATTDETVLPPASGWVAVDFSLDSAALTQTAGGGTLADTLANVSTLRFRHDPDPISPPSEIDPVTGTLGIDNIHALPEPGIGATLAAAFATLALLHRVRGGNQSSRAR